MTLQDKLARTVTLSYIALERANEVYRAAFDQYGRDLGPGALNRDRNACGDACDAVIEAEKLCADSMAKFKACE